MALLTVENLTRRFGGVVALDDVSLSLTEKEITGLIGPNGAGKTTLFNVITRLYRPQAGTVEFDGQNVLRVRPHRIVRLGIARTFQNVVLFPTMTVLENVLVGAHARMRPLSEGKGRAEALETLEYLKLDRYSDRPPPDCRSGSSSASTSLERSFRSLGCCCSTSRPAGSTMRKWASSSRSSTAPEDFDLTILLVEHHMNLVMSVSERVAVLNFGEKIAEGTPEEVRADPAVIEAYLEPRMPLLELRQVEARYGPIKALHGVSLDVGEGEIVALLGANGAGKTTTLRAVSGLVRKNGSIVFDGRPIGRDSPQAITRRGIAHVPEGRASSRVDGLGEPTDGRLRPWRAAGAEAGGSAHLRLLPVDGGAPSPAGRDAERRRAADARAGARARLSAEAAHARRAFARTRPIVVQELFRIVAELNEKDGLTVLVVEQNAILALDAAARAYVLEVGKVAIEGPSDELRRNESVRKSYLGY